MNINVYMWHTQISTELNSFPRNGWCTNCSSASPCHNLETFYFLFFFFKYKLIQAPKWSLNEAKGRLWEKKVRWHFYSKTVTSISFNLCSVYWGRISVSSFHLRAPLQSHTPCVIFVSSSPGTDSQSVSMPAGPEDTQCRKWCPLACSKEEQLFLCCRSHNSLNLKT